MKTKIILPLVCCLLFLIVTNFSFSQAPSENNYLNKTVAMSVSHETTIPNSGNWSETNKKIQKSFTRNFSGVTGETWSIAGNNFHCSFYMKGIPACVLFSKNGYLIYAITYGAEKDMPTDIRKIVKRDYYDYMIMLAVEVREKRKRYMDCTSEK
jgi:hypothetical protein